MKPVISVLLPAYNCERFIEEAVQSLLVQSFRDFEVLIMDDGSTDRTGEILDQLAKRDTRLRVFHQDNQGVVKTLNRLVGYASGRYLARMDGDDIAHRDRFQFQVNHLQTHSETGVVGAWMDTINNHGEIIRSWHPPVEPVLIHWNLYFQNALVHPSIMMRREIFEKVGPYQEEFRHAEDYELWFRIARDSKLTNLPMVLHTKRAWEESVSWKYSQQQEDCIVGILQREHSALIGKPVEGDSIRLLRKLVHHETFRQIEEIWSVEQLIENLLVVFLGEGLCPYKQRSLLKTDVARKFCSLSAAVRRISKMDSVRLLHKAMVLSPVGIPLRAIKGGLRRISRTMRSMAV